MNKNEFKNEYVEYKERLFEIDKALNKNVKDFLRFKKNDDFVYIESEVYRELVESHMEQLEEEEPDFKLPNIEKLEKEYKLYKTHLYFKTMERIDLYNEKDKVISKFENYMEKNNLIYWDIDAEWSKEVKEYRSKWYGWSSNDLICQAMYQTIRETDEDEINMIIENSKKVLELMDGRSYMSSYVNDLEFINKYLRHGDGMDGVEHVFILDCLENDGMWDIYKESFKCFVRKVVYSIDRSYISYLEELKMEETHDDLEN